MCDERVDYGIGEENRELRSEERAERREADIPKTEGREQPGAEKDRALIQS